MNGYGLWIFAVLNAAVIVLFAASFFRPSSKRDWRALGTFSAFVVALFTVWAKLVGWEGDPHFTPFHLTSYVLIIGGFWAIASWRSLLVAQTTGELATATLYARVRHPQYAGFMAIMVGFLLQWPTLPTLLMFPLLVYVYRRLAISEERETRERFGAAWDAYAAVTPRFVLRRRRPAPPLREEASAS